MKNPMDLFASATDHDEAKVAAEKQPFVRLETGKVAGKITAICDCGRHKHHARIKVLNTWADNHRKKTGHTIAPEFRA